MPAERKINEPCPICKTGHLCPVMRGLDPTPWHRRGNLLFPELIIERLGCNSCGASYEAADRGRSIVEILDAQADRLTLKKWPKRKPKKCSNCDGQDLKTGSSTPKALRPFLHGASQKERDLYRNAAAPYIYCGSCVNVLWIGTSERDKMVAKVFKAMTPAQRRGLKRAARDLFRDILS